MNPIAHVGVSQSRGLKLFGREIIFEVFQPVWKTYLNVTDGQTDGRTTYDGNTALCTKVHRAVNSYYNMMGIFYGAECSAKLDYIVYYLVFITVSQAR